VLGKYNIQIAALQEIRWTGHDDDGLTAGAYTIFYSGHDTHRVNGVGFAVAHELRQSVLEFRHESDRICVLRIKGRWFNVTIINIYAPTEEKTDDEKNGFYAALEDVVDRSPRQDVKIVLGDCNAKIGREEALRPTIGLHSLHQHSNDNGLRLVSFASARNMSVASTKFPHRDIHKGTWRSPDGRTINQIDHVLIDRRHGSMLLDVRSWRGADTNSDHMLVSCRMAMRISKNPERQYRTIRRFDTPKLENENTATRFQLELRNRFAALDLDAEGVNECWEKVRSATEDTALAVLGLQKRRKTKLWFDEDCERAVAARGNARLLALQNADNQAAQDEYIAQQRITRNLLKSKRKRFETNLVEELQSVSTFKNSRHFFERLKKFRNGFRPSTGNIRSAAGDQLTDPHQILERWKEYFEDLLNAPLPADPLPHVEPMAGPFEEPPISLEEVKKAVDRLRSRRASGVDELPAELWKHGGKEACEILHTLISKVWVSEELPDQWKEALVVPLHKKGDRKDCANYRGISLLCTAYKVLSNILLHRLLPLSEEVLGEYQCGFRSNRSTTDQIFTLRQILEKKREYNSEVHNLFVDFRKAYDSIHRDGLYNIMAEFGFPRKLIRMTAVCLSGVRSRVVANGRIGDAFAVNTGLRQGDGLSPLLFNLVLEKVVRCLENVPGGVNLGGCIKELGYADDLDLLGETRDDVRRLCGELLETASRVGLEVNEGKTEYLVMTEERTDEDPLDVGDLRFENVEEFRYLGSTVTSDNDMNREVTLRIQSGNRCLFSVGHLLSSRVLSRRAKLRIYNSVIRPCVLYGCDTWNLTVRMQERLLVFENRVLRRILGPKRDPVTGRFRMRPNEETRQLTGQPLITSVIKSRRLQWAGHVARAPPTRYIRQVLDGIPTSTRLPGRPRLRWEDNVKADAKRLGVRQWRETCQERDDWDPIVDAALGLRVL